MILAAIVTQGREELGGKPSHLIGEDSPFAAEASFAVGMGMIVL
jgi:hypothetical protein